MAEAADRVFVGKEPAAQEHVTRHKGVDRLFHWLTAAAVLTLMTTGLLPPLGVKFDWVVIHWSVGVVLVLLVLFHIVRALFWQRLKCMFWLSAKEIAGKEVTKYSIAQKLMHHAMTAMVLAAVITGCLMLMKMDTPLWKRDPYTLSQATWGIIYVIHGAAAVSAISLVFIHIYFAILTEKRMYLRAMILGWMTRRELIEHHESGGAAEKKT
ncbi:MAG: cytochrome b/b6 domain-containing protein [Gammaproteobacteria bacterium]